MSVATARLRTWIWLLIYGGLLTLGLGIAVRRTDDALGWTIAALGAVAACAGVLLIWLRSHLDDPKETR